MAKGNAPYPRRGGHFTASAGGGNPDWNEADHPRHDAGSSHGGRFRSRIALAESLVVKGMEKEIPEWIERIITAYDVVHMVAEGTGVLHRKTLTPEDVGGPEHEAAWANQISNKIGAKVDRQRAAEEERRKFLEEANTFPMGFNEPLDPALTEQFRGARHVESSRRSARVDPVTAEVEAFAARSDVDPTWRHAAETLLIDWQMGEIATPGDFAARIREFDSGFVSGRGTLPGWRAGFKPGRTGVQTAPEFFEGLASRIEKL